MERSESSAAGAVSARRRSTRDRPAKAPLSETAVVDAALEVLKLEGPDAVTMRRVAALLDTGAASLYVYVSGRDGLLEAMLDRVSAAIELEKPDPSRWREQLHALLGRMRDALLAHPGLATVTTNGPHSGPGVLLVAENLLGILLAGGLEPQDAAWTCDVLVMLVSSLALEEDTRRARGEGEAERRQSVEGLESTFAGLSAERYPLLTRYSAQMVSGDGEQRFGFAVDVVLDGVLARASRG
jgi:AcrR family transcriptional regulator